MKNYIKQMADAVASEGMRPCIKQEVRAMLMTADGRCFFGANWMTNGEVSECARVTAGSASGCDYHFCLDVCNQSFHAERAAIDAAHNFDCDTTGGVMYLLGHTYCCNGCYDAMIANGITKVIILDTDCTIALNPDSAYADVNWAA